MMILQNGKADSFAMSKAGSCLYDAIKAKAEQDTEAFQRKLEQQAGALRQEIARQEKRSEYQKEKKRKAEEQELLERKREKETLERKDRNSEEKYFKCPACGCSFKLTRGWFMNKEIHSDTGKFFVKPYKEHTCPYCKSIVQIETGERIINYEMKECLKLCMCKAIKVTAIITLFVILIGAVGLSAVAISRKIKHHYVHTNMIVQYIGHYGILDDKGKEAGACGFYNEAEDKIYWYEYADHVSDATPNISAVLEVQYYPNRSKFKLNGYTFHEIKVEEISKERVRSMCEWMTTGYTGSAAPKWCFIDVYENGDVQAENFYSLSKEGKFHSSYKSGTDGQFTPDEASEIWTMFKSFGKQKYEPYHANEDGLMVTEYQPYTVKIQYDKSDYDVMKNPNYSKNLCKYYTLTEEDYKELMNQFEKMQNAVEKQNEKGEIS